MVNIHTTIKKRTGSKFGERKTEKNDERNVLKII